MDSELQIVGSRHVLWGNPVGFPCFIALGIKILRGEANSAYKKIRDQDQNDGEHDPENAGIAEMGDGRECHVEKRTGEGVVQPVEKRDFKPVQGEPPFPFGYTALLYAFQYQNIECKILVRHINKFFFLFRSSLILLVTK